MSIKSHAASFLEPVNTSKDLTFSFLCNVIGSRKSWSHPSWTQRPWLSSNKNEGQCSIKHESKLLVLWGGDFSRSLNYLSNELGYLHWKKYPFEFLPPSFQLDKLVELYIPLSNIKQLWKDIKVLQIFILSVFFFFLLMNQ